MAYLKLSKGGEKYLISYGGDIEQNLLEANRNSLKKQPKEQSSCSICTIHIPHYAYLCTMDKNLMV